MNGLEAFVDRRSPPALPCDAIALQLRIRLEGTWLATLRRRVSPTSSTVSSEIRSLVKAGRSGAPEAADDVDRTLSDGYAEALILQRKQSRLRRRISDLIDHPSGADQSTELQRAGSELRSLERQLSELRALLDELSDQRPRADQS